MRKTDHLLYGKWSAMMHRCYKPGNSRFSRYGGRGIAVCEQWHDFYAFASWVEQHLGPCPDGHSIDRIDNDGNYEPGNVRWATRQMQNANRSRVGARPGYKKSTYWPVDIRT